MTELILVCKSNFKAESNVTPRFLANGLTYSNGTAHQGYGKLGGLNNTISNLLSFNWRKFYPVQN